MSNHGPTHDPNRQLSPEEIGALEEHLPYELDMLEEALKCWKATPELEQETLSNWFKRMSAIETFWVHARNLEEFFSREDVPSRTVIARHFVNDRYSWKAGELSTRINEVQDQIVHFNYDRPRGSGHGSNKLSYAQADRAFGEIDRAVQIFQSCLIPLAKQYWRPRRPTIIAFGPEPASTSTAAPTFSYSGPTGPSPPSNKWKGS